MLFSKSLVALEELELQSKYAKLLIEDAQLNFLEL